MSSSSISSPTDATDVPRPRTVKSMLRHMPTVSVHTPPSILQLVVHARPTTRPRTFAEQQPYILAYGTAISLVSPAATAYQLCRLYNLQQPPSHLFRMSLAILPHQTLLKLVQMNASSPVKEYLNPWAAFAAVGVLQGGVYGHCNVHFSSALQLGKTVRLAGIFRGSIFAGLRDTLSQGMPFMCSDSVRRTMLDPAYPTHPDDATANAIKQWTSVLSTSVMATYLSQGVHNCQIAMQADQSLSYSQTVRSVWKQHGMAVLYRGAEARVGLLLVVNALNELLLKPAWAPVSLSDDSSETR